MKPKELRAKVAYYCYFTGHKKEYLAYLCGMSLSTFYKRLEEPSTFSLGELSKLSKVLGLTDEEKLLLIA